MVFTRQKSTGENMDKKKLIIRPRRYGSETTVISLRLPKDMIKVIEDIATTTGRTRNEIMVMSLEYALDNMEIEEK
jgi:hypothetical protein